MANNRFPLGCFLFFYDNEFNSALQYCRSRAFEVEKQHNTVYIFDCKEFDYLREFCIPFCVKVYIISEIGAEGASYSCLMPLCSGKKY